MRERARDRGRLIDIVEHADRAIQLIEGFSFDAFVADVRTYYAVMKNVEVVGEATYMLSQDFKEAHPEIPWPAIQGLRHVLVHGYSQVVPETLYDTTINDIPAYRDSITKFLELTDWVEWSK